MRARRTRWLIISAMGSTIGCADSVSPQDFVGEYALTRIQGDPLPALMFNNNISPTIVADTIRLRADGTGSRDRVIAASLLRSALPVGSTPPTATRTDLIFKVTGGVLAITYVCPPNANCTPTMPHAFALRTASGLKITHETGARVPEEFVAVAR